MHKKETPKLKISAGTAATLALMACTAVLIAGSGILVKQSLLRIAPLFISLLVSFLQTKANRYAPLIGSFNSILYAYVYIHYRLYATAAYAVFFSFPIQLATFINWNRHPYQNSTMLKRLTRRQRTLLAAAFLLVWISVCYTLSFLDSDYRFLDTTISLLGILSSFLAMFSFVEHTDVMLANQCCTFALYLTMIGENPEQVTYLIYTAYGFICTVLSRIRFRKVYRQQQEVKEPDISITTGSV